jgi:lysozyme family protein
MTNQLPRIYFERLIQSEGGYVNDPKDRGGETKFGISKRAFPELDIKNLTKEAASDIYSERYWMPVFKILGLREDLLPTAYVLFDFAVNSGVGAATKGLQRALGVTPDGEAGAKTRAALEMAIINSQTQLIYDISDQRIKLIRDLVAAGKLDRTFEKGIIARIGRVRNEALHELVS